MEHKKWYRRFLFSRDRIWTTTSFNKITHDNIRVSRAYRESTLGQTWLKLPKISEKFEFDVKLWKVLFCAGFDLIWPLVNPRLTRCILVILAETLWVLRYPNELLHIILNVLVAPWRENNIFGFFRIRHTNQGQTKYGINRLSDDGFFFSLTDGPLVMVQSLGHSVVFVIAVPNCVLESCRWI